jgi:hypothetical protein
VNCDASLDDLRFVLKVVSVTDVMEAQALVAEQTAVFHRIDGERMVHQRGAIALAVGTLALVLDEVTGGSLAHVLGARGQLTPGETVTTVALLSGAPAELHAPASCMGIRHRETS